MHHRSHDHEGGLCLGVSVQKGASVQGEPLSRGVSVQGVSVQGGRSLSKVVGLCPGCGGSLSGGVGGSLSKIQTVNTSK